MSAIFGITDPETSAADARCLDVMGRQLVHRGAHVRAESFDGGRAGIGTGARRQSSGVTRSGHLHIVADARIDNRAEILAGAGLPDTPEAPRDAAGVILAAYTRWGRDCAEKLIGDFAFVIWDDKERCLFGARDAFGVRPFFYRHRDGRSFAFASEIKALLVLPWVPRELNHSRAVQFLNGDAEDTAATFYRDIFRLPPAHSFTVDMDARLTVRRYWALNPIVELEAASADEYADRFRVHFCTAVDARLKVQATVGLTVSGGLDSSAVACVARRHQQETGPKLLPTFSAAFDAIPGSDERTYINAVLAGGGLEPHFIDAMSLSPMQDISAILSALDEPFLVPNIHLFWGGIYPCARDHGVGILLDGVDGDTTVSHGLARLSELARTGHWFDLLSEIRALAATGAYGSLSSLAWQYGIRPIVPAPVLRAARGRHRRGNVSLVRPELIASNGSAAHSNGNAGTPPPWLNGARCSHWQSLNSGMVTHILEVANLAAAPFGIEPSHPFFDRRLAEFCLALPSEQKLKSGVTRAVMRRALKDLLPASVCRRVGKGDLSPSFVRGLRDRDRDILRDVMENRIGNLEPFVDLHRLRSIWRRFADTNSDYDAITVWKSAVLSLWLDSVRLNP